MPKISSDIIRVPCGAPFTREITAPAGYRIASLAVDGVAVAAAVGQVSYVLELPPVNRLTRNRVKVCLEEIPLGGGSVGGGQAPDGFSIWTQIITTAPTGEIGGIVAPPYYNGLGGEDVQMFVQPNTGYRIVRIELRDNNWTDSPTIIPISGNPTTFNININQNKYLTVIFDLL
ncbi:hypothetical protein [Rhodoflexus caldus]|uniref:hypothetical protein n=1 Tax=Rhodoflexus caldus TaxID=2891236 RepID=UPI00202A9BB3|nr:hypothetical protein [Rhodoflexus caldus]